MPDDQAPDPAEPPPLPVPTGAHAGEPGTASARALDTTDSAQPTRPPQRKSKAGRNLPAAIGVGVLLGGLCIASLFWIRELFGVLLVVTVAQAVRELVAAFRQRDIHVPLVPVLVGTLGMAVSAYLGGPQALFYALILTCLAVLGWRLLDRGDGLVRDVAAGIFVAGYVPYLAGFAVLMLAAPDGPWRIVTMIAVPVFSDIGGYAFGVLWGRHPMAPSVSPKKSWEGLAGSMVFGIAAGVFCMTIGLSGPWWGGIIVGVCAVVTGVLGDLSESLLKRDLGIKDMGNLLPGHGGVLDRIDSLLPTAPVMYLLLALIVPVQMPGLG